MEIKVRLFSFFREYAPDPNLVVTLSPKRNTVADLIEILEVGLGERFAREVAREIAHNPHLQTLVFVGTESIQNLEQLSTTLKDGDTVKFLPPMSGG